MSSPSKLCLVSISTQLATNVALASGSMAIREYLNEPEEEKGVKPFLEQEHPILIHKVHC